MVNIGRSGMWRPTVQPWVERVAAALAGQGRSTHSVFVGVEGVRVLVTPLEQELARSIGDAEGSTFARKHILVRDCLGLRVKMACGLAMLDRAGEAERGALLTELATDVDLGCELMHELTLEMKGVSAAGSLDEAKELSQYRKQLLLLVEQAESRTQPTVGGDDSIRGEAVHAGRPRATGAPAAKRPPAPVRPRSQTRRPRWPIWAALAVLAVLAAAVGAVLLLGR